jgi:hypothetical protein
MIIQQRERRRREGKDGLPSNNPEITPRSFVGASFWIICYYLFMAEAGYKSLLSYKLASIAFELGWEFVPVYYYKYEDGRQRDQIKQALRSYKQNTCPAEAIGLQNG